jgi:hypothetical protein
MRDGRGMRRHRNGDDREGDAENEEHAKNGPQDNSHRRFSAVRIAAGLRRDLLLRFEAQVECEGPRDPAEDRRGSLPTWPSMPCCSSRTKADRSLEAGTRPAGDSLGAAVRIVLAGVPIRAVGSSVRSVGSVSEHHRMRKADATAIQTCSASPPRCAWPPDLSRSRTSHTATL